MIGRRRLPDDTAPPAPLLAEDVDPELRALTAPASTRERVLWSLSAAQTALGALSDPRRYAHIGRIQWLIDAIFDGTHDLAWYAAGLADGKAQAGERRQVPCVDPDTYADIWNRGFDAANAQQLAEDPSLAEEWLAEKIAAARAEVEADGGADLTPFRQALDEIERRMRATGGGVQDAYHNAAELIRSAFAQYQEIPK